MIDVTGVDLKKLAKAAYALSIPRGRGFFQNFTSDLTEQQVTNLVDRFKDDLRIALSMDYVNGRGCKLTVFKENGKLLIEDKWFDHTTEDLQNLLKEVGINKPVSKEKHAIACECADCIERRKI